MPIADSHAERRNLTVLSMAIIVYFLAGGELAADRLALPMVNLVLHDTRTLVILLWVMLGWFALRYWQEAKTDGRAAIRKALETHVYMNHPAIRKLVRQQENLGKDPQISTFRPRGEEWNIQYIVRKEDGTSAHSGRKTAVLKGPKAKVAIFRATLRMSLTHGSVWSYWMPYVLAWMALLLGLYHLAIPEAVDHAGQQALLCPGLIASHDQHSLMT